MSETDASNLDAKRITSIEDLEALYDTPVQRALDKEIDYISEHYRAFIDASPFVILATSGPEGLDCSPRGDPPGFVRVLDDKTVALPDRRGNNRLDSLRNIIRDDRVSLLFLVPGIGETLRLNGCAHLSADDTLCTSFAVSGKAPKTVIIVTVERVYFQCQKALVRSKLWEAESRVTRNALPSAGQMLEAVSSSDFDGKRYDDGYAEHLKKTIY